MICMNFSEPKGAFAEHLQAAEAPAARRERLAEAACGAVAEFLRNKTGTWRPGMLYVDNRGSSGARDRRAYRVRLQGGPKAVPREYQGDPKTMPAARAESLAGRAIQYFREWRAAMAGSVNKVILVGNLGK